MCVCVCVCVCVCGEMGGLCAMSNICPLESSDREVSAGKTRGRKRREGGGDERQDGEGCFRRKLKKPS